MSEPLNERAIEAADRAFENPHRNRTDIEITRDAIAAYLASLAEQGVVLVDVQEVAYALRAQDNESDYHDGPSPADLADFIERRFAKDTER